MFDGIFDSKGDFVLKYFDPYRLDEENPEEKDFYDKIFNENGALKESIYDLQKYINENDFPTFSDAVKLFYAQEHGSKTCSSYPAIYMWR